MKFELDALRLTVTPIVDKDNSLGARQAARREIRLATDKVIHNALLQSDLPCLVESSVQAMITVAEALLSFNEEPEVEDFVYAAKELLEDARKVVDAGLQQAEWRDVRTAAVMLEIVVRGICATLSVDYEDEFLKVCDAACAD